MKSRNRGGILSQKWVYVQKRKTENPKGTERGICQAPPFLGSDAAAQP